MVLAGDAGKELENKTSPLFAAMQIYKKSDPDNVIPLQRFFDNNEDALKDMERLANAEKESQNTPTKPGEQ